MKFEKNNEGLHVYVVDNKAGYCRARDNKEQEESKERGVLLVHSNAVDLFLDIVQPLGRLGLG